MIDKTRLAAEYTFALRALSYYTRLVPPSSDPSATHELGGKLLYVGEPDHDGRALIAAANIAGAASLCATEDLPNQRQAVRDGVVDFLVKSLDEAVRILKNEIRKHTPVAVCISVSSAEIEAQMAERGLLPDLLRPDHDAPSSGSVPEDVALLSWSVSEAPARWMPKLDAFALECAGNLPASTRRWIEMSPRYLGRLAQSIHLVLADMKFAPRFMEGAMALEGGSIPLRLQVSYQGGCEEYNAPNWDKDDPVPSPSAP